MEKDKKERRLELKEERKFGETLQYLKGGGQGF